MDHQLPILMRGRGLAPIILAAALASGAFITADSKNEQAQACFARCSGLDATMQQDCLKACLRGRRLGAQRNSDVRKGTGSKMPQCEERCKELQGLEKIKCLRMCMEGE